jgi:hypothetical protein
MSRCARATEFDDDLMDRIRAAVEIGSEIQTLSIKRPNRIVGVDRKGIEVETLRSESRGSGPQLVPAWMVVAAWERLRRRGQLSQTELLNELNVKRSAFVCALLALFPDVVVRSTRPTVLTIVSL